MTRTGREEMRQVVDILEQGIVSSEQVLLAHRERIPVYLAEGDHELADETTKAADMIAETQSRCIAQRGAYRARLAGD